MPRREAIDILIFPLSEYMRYNLYRQYKTLSGYNSKQIVNSIQYIEKNYQFQWRSYDLIKSLPSDIFQQYFGSPSSYAPGFKLVLKIDTNNFLKSATVKKRINSEAPWQPVYELPFEPNTYMYYIPDPDLLEDDEQDIQVRGYDSNNSLLRWYNASDNSEWHNTLYCVSAAWTDLPAMTTSGDDKKILVFYNRSEGTQTYYASNVDYLEIEYTIDSDDTQEGISPFVVYQPTFVPIE